MKKLLSIIFVLFTGSVMFAQTSITGTVKEAKTGEPIPGANVKVEGKSIGTTTDFDGNFSFKVAQNPPFTLEISLIGYASTKVEITQSEQRVSVVLDEAATALDEVVVSASRTPERVLESPVTIERMDVREIKNTSSPSFYDGLENLKGVDVNTNSLTFKSINTRGFATFANTRFMQLVDGMDNSSPALNFNLGNLLGMSELDVSTVELLPGASSALYGANAFNGILFMTSKSPFESAGVSVYGKTGITSQKAAGDNQFVDAGIRMAYKFSDKFAAKASFSYMKGTEWYATDYEDYENPGYTRANPDYDGLNVYGDEVFTTLNFTQIALANNIPAPYANMMGSSVVSRTGYNEVDLMDGYDAESAKADFALHFRPFANNFEIILNSKFGSGNTIYQGANRYNINNFFMQQHKLEIKGDNFFVRGYITDEDAGDSYDSRFAAININRSWKSDTQWFTEYAGAYLQTFMGTLLAGGTPNPALIHQQARAFAQTGALVPGTEGFKTAFDKVTSDPDLATGAKFQDASKIYHTDANYNFGDAIDFADIQVGGSWRQYSLNSSGTIFTDYDGPINYEEYGAYMQLQKKFVDDRLKFTGSIRYDKAQNFDGNVSPRVSLSYSLGQGKTRNLRASFQTGFRNPTTQDQYIGLDAGRAYLVGSAPDNIDRYFTPSLSLSSTAQAIGFPSSVILSGRQAYDNSWTLASVTDFATQAAQGNVNPSLLEKSSIAYVKPEKVSAYEVGYRAGFGRLSLDMSAYYNQYQDFIGNKTVVVPMYGKADLTDITPLPPQFGGPAPTALIALNNRDYKAFQTYTNSAADISSYGATVGIDTKVMGNYSFGVNYTYAKFEFDQATDPDYEAGFNTPE
ncbi:MAG: TonB-dependent receptor, partial [Lutibacter sp.]